MACPGWPRRPAGPSVSSTTDVEAGDHRLLFGLVTQASRRDDTAPLVYADQTYGTHSRFAVRSPRPITDQIAAFMR